MEEIIGLKFEQNSRDNLIFELFAKDEIKADLSIIKEKALKQQFKRMWVGSFCQAIRCVQDKEYHIPASRLAETLSDFFDKLALSGYYEIAFKYVMLPTLFCSNFYLSDNDLL